MAGGRRRQRLIGPNKKDEQAKPPAVQDKPDDRTGEKKQLNLLVDHFLIDKADITFIDAQPSQPVKIEINPLRLSVSRLSLKKGDLADIDLALVMDKKSNLTAKGSVGIEPLAADLALEVKGLAIRPFQPYFTESVQMDITRGSISTAGKFSLAMDAKNKPSVKYQGNLSVSDLATVDKANERDFLKWKKLNFQSLTAGYNPLFVNIKEISLDDFFSKIVIHPGGGTNIQDIFSAQKTETDQPKAPQEKQPDEQVRSAKPAQAPPDIKIGKVSFQKWHG